jgi:hypothetical protein
MDPVVDHKNLQEFFDVDGHKKLIEKNYLEVEALQETFNHSRYKQRKLDELIQKTK